jgi:glycerol-3-phosphate cytidylyltransferase-like family protein
MKTKKFGRGKLRDLVVEAMSAHPTKVEFSPRELSKELGMPIIQVGGCLRRMAKTGECHVEGSKHSSYKKYSLTSRAKVLHLETPVVEVVEEEERFPTADELVEAIFSKVVKLEDQAEDDANIIQDLVKENSDLKAEVDRLQLKVNERKSFVRRLAERV